MAILATVTTEHGEERELYIRLNNMNASNHGVHSKATFRGFASKASFDEGKRYMYEHEIGFMADVSKPLWEQAYSELKKEIDFSTEDV